MIVEIRLLARLVRIPLLRVEGVVTVREPASGEDLGDGVRVVTVRSDGGARPGGSTRPGVGARPEVGREAGGTMGRDLAVAEAIMAELEAQGRRSRR
jgi:hypothetical protein